MSLTKDVMKDIFGEKIANKAISLTDQFFENEKTREMLKKLGDVDYFDCAGDTVKSEKKYVKCSCGCSVSEILVMHADCGTSCPDCYDRLCGERNW